MTSAISVSDLIAHIESSNNPYAYRFEPTVYARLTLGAMTPDHAVIVNKIQKIHSCSLSSAQVIYSSSYGLYQIMGFNLYGVCGCPFQFGEVLNRNDLQNMYFAYLLSTMKLQNESALDLAMNPAMRHLFAVTYNGSSAYESAIVAALQYFKIPVTN